MSAIIIQQCPACRTNKENIPRAQWKSVADPNCPDCKGGGTTEIDKEKRLENDRMINEVLEQTSLMEEMGIDWVSMSDEEFEKWKP